MTGAAITGIKPAGVGVWLPRLRNGNDLKLSSRLDGPPTSTPPSQQTHNITLLKVSITHTHTTVLQLCGICPGQPRWAGTRRNIHPLHSSLSAFSIYYDLRHPPYSIHLLYSLFPQSLSKFFLVYLLAWYPPPYTLYISSPNHCLLFAAHAHTITTCSAVVLSNVSIKWHQFVLKMTLRNIKYTLCLKKESPQLASPVNKQHRCLNQQQKTPKWVRFTCSRWRGGIWESFLSIDWWWRCVSIQWRWRYIWTAGGEYVKVNQIITGLWRTTYTDTIHQQKLK